jgi:prepilin-type N-terminal cleavage/methylation domain-containing protein
MKSISMRKQDGFTLIELMIVIAILGILLAIAIPAYQDYSARARASEGLNLAASAKTSVSEFALSEGEFPTDNAEAGYMFAATSIVSDIAIANGVITVMTDNAQVMCQTDAPVFELTPMTGASGVEWACTATMGEECAPSSCRN